MGSKIECCTIGNYLRDNGAVLQPKDGCFVVNLAELCAITLQNERCKLLLCVLLPWCRYKLEWRLASEVKFSLKYVKTLIFASIHTNFKRPYLFAQRSGTFRQAFGREQ